MRILTSLLLSIFCLSLSAQAPVFEDLIFEADSITTNYKAKGKNYAFIRSKRGTDGLTKTTTGDSIVAKKIAITDIYLVFTEMSSAEIATRETENRERWENMLKTYPDFFTESPNLYNVCQCNSAGNAESFKKTQGFYVYFEGKEEPVAVAPKVEPKKEEKKEVAEPKKKEKVEKVKEEKKVEPKEEKTVKAEKPAKEEKAEKAEKPKKEKKEKEAVVVKEEVKETPVVVEEVKEVKPKKEGYAKPRKAKDVKVCRPPCYDGGDEGLNAFLKENIILSKKQKRKSGELVCIVTLQLNFDGSIKKTLFQGTNTEFNKQVEDAIKKMDLWNPAVKGGVTIKSQVKLTLKYDGSTKAIKPFETMITPRPSPKCTECLSDSQVFAD